MPPSSHRELAARAFIEVSEHGGPDSDANAREFAASMPPAYVERFDGAAIREHAGIVERRAGSAAHAEVWCALPGGGAIACVVADDAPGLLSLISAALVVHALDVEAAQAFGRELSNGRTEVVDFFWLKRTRAAGTSKVMPTDVGSMGKMLDALLRGRLDIDDVVRLGAQVERKRSDDLTQIRFERAAGKVVTELEIDTLDRAGLLFAVTRALFNQRVQIVRSDVRTVAGRANDRFDIVEFDGARLKPSRLTQIEAELREAVAALARAAL